MSDSSSPLQISAERHVDPSTLEILRLIDGLLRSAGIPYMLVGATARDLLLHHVYGHNITRATYDVDYAILVDSWEKFETVKKLFLSIPGFIDRGREKQRLYYQLSPFSPSTVVDIIPFGQLETSEQTIVWPPDAEVVMNVAAFSDVLASSLVVEVEPNLVIPVPSLPGLIVLKLFAWLDRRDSKDVQDMRRILETYTDTGNIDRLYEEEPSELELVAFDTVLGGAFLLGRDAQRVVAPDIANKLSIALTGDTISDLVQHMARSMSILEDRTEESTILLKQFFRGMGLEALI